MNDLDLSRPQESVPRRREAVPERGRPTPGGHALNVCGAIGLVWCLGYALWGDQLGITLPLLSQFAGILGLLVMLLVGVLIGSTLDDLRSADGERR